MISIGGNLIPIIAIVSVFMAPLTSCGYHSAEVGDDRRTGISVDRNRPVVVPTAISSTTEVTAIVKEDEIDKEKRKKQRQQHRRSCCGDNDDLKLLWGEGVRDLKRECFEQAKRAAEATRKERMEIEDYEGFIRGNRTKDEYVCTVQCIGQKKEVLDRMGNVRREEMGEYVKKTYSSEPWKAEIADQVLEKCFSETQRPSEGEVSTDNGDVTNGRSVQAKCNSNGIAFIHCLWREMQLNCPVERIRDNRKCNKLRDRLLRRGSTNGNNGTDRSLF